MTTKDMDAMEKKCQTSFAGRVWAIRKACHQARRNLANEYEGILGRVKDKFTMKKVDKETEIRLQEVTTDIGLLTEFKEGGFEVDDKLKRLWEKESKFDIENGLAAVSDFSIRDVDLPEVFDDSIN